MKTFRKILYVLLTLIIIVVVGYFIFTAKQI